MASGLKFDIEIDHKSLRQAFDAIGSEEYFRAVQFALDETAKAAKTSFTGKLPDALGKRKGNGPSGRPDRLSLDPVRYERSRNYSSFRGVKDLTARISIKPVQSTWMKYGFGDAVQDREPGDVGIAADRLLIPNGMNLYYQCGIKTPGFGRTMGGMDRDAMGAVKNLMAGADGAAPQSRRAVLQATARTARHKGAVVRGQRRTDAAYLSSAARSSNAFDRVMGDMVGKHLPEDRRRTAVKEATAAVKAADQRNRYTRVFRGPDRVTGLPAYYSRNGRVRDPAGGCRKAWTRPDGTPAMMPEMLTFMPRGKAGARQNVGPARLFEAVPRGSYLPRLQEPWMASADEAYALFDGFMQRELSYRLKRRAEGRKY